MDRGGGRRGCPGAVFTSRGRETDAIVLHVEDHVLVAHEVGAQHRPVVLCEEYSERAFVSVGFDEVVDRHVDLNHVVVYTEEAEEQVWQFRHLFGIDVLICVKEGDSGEFMK